jgi:hypothetical protein
VKNDNTDFTYYYVDHDNGEFDNGEFAAICGFGGS